MDLDLQRTVSWLAAALALCGGTRGQGVSLTIANAGFEQPAIASGTFSTSAAPPGWTVYGAGIDFGFRTVGVLDPGGSTLYATAVPEGENVGVVFLLDDFANQTAFAGIEAGLEQMLTATVQADTQYTLTVQVGNIADDATPPNSSFQFAGFPGYRIELLANGAPVAVDPGLLVPAEGTFLESTIVFTTAASDPLVGAALGVRLVQRNAGPGLEVNFDDVRLVALDIAFPSTCNGDGGDGMGCTDCPCANDAPPGTPGGCRNSTGRSARLLASGTASVTAADLRMTITGATASTFAALVSGDALAPTNPVNPCFGSASGVQSAALDGLRCAALAVQRHGARPSDANGDVGVVTSAWGPPDGPPGGLAAQGGFVAGQTRHYQAIYREQAALGCQSGQNSTQALSVVYFP